MGIGALTRYIDVPQVVLYVFWLFFAGLIYYLRREDKREGYPLESDRSGNIQVQGLPRIPAPKIFKRAGGGSYSAPPGNPESREIRAAAAHPWNGSPLLPSGDPMADGVGPASYAERADHPDLAIDGEPLLVPMRLASAYTVAAEDPDPRQMPVIGADGQLAGTVSDLWIDRAEPQIRYLEVTLAGVAQAARTVLLPIGFARINKRRRSVQVVSILSTQFAAVPALSNPDRVTLREEDRITGYYAGGHLYAEPSRLGPLL